MRRTSFILFFLTVLSGLAAPACHSEDARALLVRSLREGDMVALSGEQVTVVTGPKTRRQVVQRIRRKPNRLRIEYVAPRGVQGEVMVDNGTLYRHYIPRLRIVEEGESRLRRARRQQARQITAVEAGKVQVTEEREDTVAGRPARGLLVTSPAAGRPRRLWIDRERAVVLKVEETGRNGQTVTTSFTRIDFGAAPPESDFVLHLPAGTQVVPARLGRPIPLARAQELAKGWGGLYQPAWLPPGFALHSAFRTRIRQEPAIALLFANRDRAFTLFQGRRGELPPARRQRNLVMLARSAGDVTLTIVGNLPQDQLQRILNSAAR